MPLSSSGVDRRIREALRNSMGTPDTPNYPTKKLSTDLLAPGADSGCSLPPDRAGHHWRQTFPVGRGGGLRLHPGLRRCHGPRLWRLGALNGAERNGANTNQIEARVAGVDRKVSCGSLADISGKGYQGCPHLKADMLSVSIDVRAISRHHSGHETGPTFV